MVVIQYNLIKLRFFQDGMRNASSNQARTEAVLRERLMMVVSTFIGARWHVLKMDAGMGSRLQDLMGDWVINFSTVSRETD